LSGWAGFMASHGNPGVHTSGGITRSGSSGQADVPWGGCVASHKVLGVLGRRRHGRRKGSA